jgi:protein-tyrosine-phosphatase
VVALIGGVQEVTSAAPLDETWRELLKILTEAVRDLDADKLSEESFNSFRVILQMGMEVAKERRALLSSTSNATRPVADSLHSTV